MQRRWNEYTLHLLERCMQRGEIRSLQETTYETMVIYVFSVRFLHYNLPVRSIDWVNWEQIEGKVGFRNQWKPIKLRCKLTSEYLLFTWKHRQHLILLSFKTLAGVWHPFVWFWLLPIPVNSNPQLIYAQMTPKGNIHLTFLLTR